MPVDARQLTRGHWLAIASTGELAIVAARPVARSLRELCEETGAAWSPPRVRAIALPLGRALAELHDAGIVHRDLSPSAVLVAPDHTIYLGAWDAAVTIGEATPAGPAREPGYRAPELAHDATYRYPAADLFAFGAIVYELVTGRRAFAGATSLEQLLATLAHDPSPPSGTPRLAELCMRLLAKLPEHRPASMRAVVDELDAATAELVALAPGARVAGRFVLDTLAGRGGMGEVWRAHDTETGEIVALKLFDSDGGELDRSLREARALAELSHPDVVRYLAHGKADEHRRYLAMEWLDGEDLARRLARGRLDVGETLQVCSRVAAALGAVHARGIVHRDLKPHNVFLVGGALDRVKLLDFGLARTTADRMTRTGVILGTAGYMAPEQVERGAKRLDARADIFALGCVLYECLIGRPPFAGDHIMAILAKMMIEPAPRLRARFPDVDGELDELVSQMLAKDPDARPRDGADVASRLASIAERTTGATRAPRTESITDSERQLLAVVLVTGPDLPVRDLEAVAASFRARTVRLGEDAMLCVLAAGGVPIDQATKAARCALAVRRAAPACAIAVATGLGEVARAPTSAAIDRAVALLAQGGPDPRIVVDEVTAGLLDATFEVERAGGVAVLCGERAIANGGHATPFVGRDRELASLRALFDECTSDPAAKVVLVTAPAGTGKSRLVAELLRALGRRGEILVARGDPLRVGSPFGMMAGALRAACGILVGEPAADSERKLRARLARCVGVEHIARIATFLGELAGIPNAGDRPELRAAREDAVVMGDQIRSAFADWLAAETAIAPVLIVLEDLHWGDLPSVKLIEYALRGLSESPLCVIAVGRPETHELFPKFAARAELVTLSPLARKPAARLAALLLGEQADDATIARVVAHANGNAFYLEELCRAVAHAPGSALPETVLAMVQTRIAALPADARRLLRVASVFGEVVYAGGVAAILGDGHDVDGWLRSLCDQELLVRRSERRLSDGDEYGFRHALLREGAYAMLTDDDRELCHRLAATWLIAAGEPEAAVLAEHLERGGDRPSALGWYQRAAEQAIEGNDYDSSLARVERAEACGAGGETLAELRQIAAHAHLLRGNATESLRCGVEAMRILADGTLGPVESSVWYKAAADVVWAAGRCGDLATGVAVAQALAMVPASGTPDTACADAWGRAANSPYIVSEHPELSEAFERRLEQAAAIAGEHALIAEMWSNALAGTRAYYVSGDPWRLYRSYVVAGNAARRRGDWRHGSQADVYVGIALALMGDLDGSVKVLHDALVASERLAIGFVASMARTFLGRCRSLQGAHADAAALISRSIADCVANQTPRLEQSSRYELATVRAATGDHAGAVVEAKTAADAARGKAPFIASWALGRLALAQLALGHPRDALDAATEAMQIVTTLGGVGTEEVVVRRAHAEALRATGDDEGARRALQAAREHVLAHAANIADDALRASFLRAPRNVTAE